MQLRTLHILCRDKALADRVRKLVHGHDAVIDEWEAQNGDTVSLFYLVNEEDQELFDKLEAAAERKSDMRMVVSAVNATFPKNYKDIVQDKEENSPTFFDVISREGMTALVSQQSRTNGTYLSLVAISAVVATIALIKGNAAVLIGAMVLTPLLGPNLAFALSTSTGAGWLGRQALVAGGVGVALSFVVTLLTAWLMGQGADAQMANLMLGFGYESIPIAVCAGLAATLLLLQGSLSSLIGVMVAVAFLPPLALSGLGLANGNMAQFSGGLLLFAVNITSFNLAAKGVLLLAGIRPRVPKEGSSLRANLAYMAGWLVAILLLCVALYFQHN